MVAASGGCSLQRFLVNGDVIFSCCAATEYALEFASQLPGVTGNSVQWQKHPCLTYGSCQPYGICKLSHKTFGNLCYVIESKTFERGVLHDT